MKDFEDVQRLLRLKRYESPGEIYFKEFTDAVKERQRAELLKRSSLSLFGERLGMWWSEHVDRKFVLPAAGAVAAAAVGTAFLMKPGDEAFDDSPPHPLAGAFLETDFDSAGAAVETIELRLPESGPDIPGAVPNAAQTAGSPLRTEGSILPTSLWGSLREL